MEGVPNNLETNQEKSEELVELEQLSDSIKGVVADVRGVDDIINAMNIAVIDFYEGKALAEGEDIAEGLDMDFFPVKILYGDGSNRFIELGKLQSLLVDSKGRMLSQEELDIIPSYILERA